MPADILLAARTVEHVDTPRGSLKPKAVRRGQGVFLLVLPDGDGDPSRRPYPVATEEDLIVAIVHVPRHGKRRLLPGYTFSWRYAKAVNLHPAASVMSMMSMILYCLELEPGTVYGNV